MAMEHAGSQNRKKSLWDIAVNASMEQENQLSEQRQMHAVVVLGSSGVGKTTLIYKYLERSDAVKPTLALEYSFGRRTGHNLAKQTVHIWELGNGSVYSSLLGPLLTPELLASKEVSFILMLDLSSPQTFWTTFDALMKALNDIMKEFKIKKPDAYDKSLKSAWERVGKEHTDASKLEPFPLPVTIVGGKYDVFANMDPEEKKNICRCLRYAALTIGASLQFYSTKYPLLVKRGRELLNHYGFGAVAPKAIAQDYNAPIAIPVGVDTLQHIGLTNASSLGHVKHIFTTYFPQKGIEREGIPDDPAKNVNFRESAIDARRALKDEELERLKREVDRRQQLAKTLDFDLDI